MTPPRPFDEGPIPLSPDDLAFGVHLSGWLVAGILAASLMPSGDAYGIDQLPDSAFDAPRERVRVRVAPLPPAKPIPEPRLDPLPPTPRSIAHRSPDPSPQPRGSGTADEAPDASDAPETLASHLLGTRGESRSALVASLWDKDEAAPAATEALRQAGAADEEDAEQTRRRPDRGGPAKGGPIDRIGIPDGGGTADLSVTWTLEIPDPPASPPGKPRPPPVDPRPLNAEIAGLRYCYEKRLMVVPGLEGRVELALSEGRAPSLVVDTTGDEPLVRCVVNAARRWDLGGLRGVGEITVPIVFRPDK